MYEKTVHLAQHPLSGAFMIFSRGTIYFDEVARRGSVRRAAEHLHIVPSAVNRQILQLEESFGLPLFERLPQGMRLTTAGEMLIDSVRRWQRDLRRVQSHMDDLQGLRRGEVSIALVEGAADFFAESIAGFHAKYPAIAYRLYATGALSVADLVLSGEYELGLTFNPPQTNALRTEAKLGYQLGIVTRPDHPLALEPTTSLAQCSKYPLVIPNETMSLRRVLDELWAKNIGGELPYSAVASNVGIIKSLVKNGFGIGVLTLLDALAETRTGELRFISLTDEKILPSVLCIISAAGRTLSVPAHMLLRHLSQQLSEVSPG
jgi:DNA-binding transcriptional LysR family regulator